MKKRFGKKELPLIALLLVLCAAVWWISRTGTSVKAEDYDVKLAAASRMQQCMDAVKGYKAELGIALNPEDWHETGMIGVEFNGITTTLGDVEAKRTAANSDMAALAVQLFREAGVKPGDAVGVGLSGSFPAMNLAVLCAGEELGVKLLTIPSMGSSTFGANNPELTFPVMLERLIRDGLLTDSVLRVTVGGDGDCGLSMDPELREEAEAAVTALGVELWKEPDFQKNLRERQALYAEEGPIVCYVGVGGNMTSIGRGAENMAYGVTLPEQQMAPVTDKSGLLEIYHAEGLPVVNLLNIKKLCADYGLAFDPAALPEPGTSAVYYAKSYSAPLAIAALIFAAAGLALYRYWRKKP